MNKIHVLINGELEQFNPGITIAAALAGRSGRRSPNGEARAAFCGMGCCFECRVTVNGQRQQRGCQIVISEWMEIICDE